MAGNALSRLVNNNLETTVIIFLSYETLRAFNVRTLTQESFLYMQINEWTLL